MHSHALLFNNSICCTHSKSPPVVPMGIYTPQHPKLQHKLKCAVQSSLVLHLLLDADLVSVLVHAFLIQVRLFRYAPHPYSDQGEHGADDLLQEDVPPLPARTQKAPPVGPVALDVVESESSEPRWNFLSTWEEEELAKGDQSSGSLAWDLTTTAKRDRIWDGQKGDDNDDFLHNNQNNTSGFNMVVEVEPDLDEIGPEEDYIG